MLWLALPLFLLGLAAAWLVVSDPLRAFNNGAPPVERLTFERRVLDNTGIHLLVRAGGSEPMTIAQVQVDDAYWTFLQDPPGDLARLSTAWIHVPFPWTLGEAHAVRVVTKTGTTFDHEIPVAVRTPEAQSSQLVPQAMLGAFVGIVPVAIGLMFYPALRGVGSQGMSFLLALTIGLLAFLFVDSLEDALELAGEAAAAFQGRDGGARGHRQLSPALGHRPPPRRPDRAGAGNLHRARDRPAQPRRGARHRCRLHGRSGRARHLPRARLHASQHHRGHRDRRPPGEGAAAALRLRRAGAAGRRARPSWACGSAASPTARNGRPWRWRSAPARSFRSSWRSGLISRRLDERWKTASVPVSVIGGLVAGLSLMYATAVLVKV